MLNRNSAIRIAVSLVVGILLLIAVMWWVGIDEIGAAIGSASPGWLAAASLIVIPAYIFKAMRWKLLLLPVKKNISVSSTFWSSVFGGMVNTLIPIRLGEFARAYILGEKEKTGFAPCFSSIVVERTLDLIGLLSIGVVTMLMVSAQSNLSIIVANIFTVVAVLIVAILVIIILGVKKEKMILALVTRVVSKIPFVKKYTVRIVEFAKSLIKGLQGLSQKPKMLVTNLALTWTAWLIHTSAVYLTFVAFGYPISFISAILGGTLMSLSHILPATPGYVGSYEAFWVLIFTMLGVSEIDVVLSIGLVSHIIGALPVIVAGCISVIWFGVSLKEVFSFKNVTAQSSA